MSDLLEVRQKTIEGKKWRKSITITLDGTDYQLTIRQLTDSEFFPVYNTLDIEKLKEFAEENEDSDEFERLQELRNKDDLTDEEQAEFEELQDDVMDEQGRIIDALGEDGFNALQDAGKAAVVPDKEDIDAVMEMAPSDRKEEFGEKPRNAREAREVLEREVEKMLEDSISLIAFNAGIQAFMETLGEEGN